MTNRADAKRYVIKVASAPMTREKNTNRMLNTPGL